MGLFDGYSDPPPWPESGGLLARLMAIKQEQDQYQPGAGFDTRSSAADAQAPSSSSAVASSLLSPLLPSTSWPMPSAGAVNDGQMSIGSPASPPDMNSHYEALRPLLGDHHAMIATVHPEVGQSLIAQALANRRAAGHAGSANAIRNDLQGNAGSAADSFGKALSDFYRQTLLQAGKDTSGYLKDAVNDPAAFAHSIGPSVGGLSPAASDVPMVVRGVLGLFGILRQPVGSSIGGLTTDRYPQTESAATYPGDKSASTPVGRRGNPLDVKAGTNQPANIRGRIYSGHASDRMQESGVPPSAVEDAIQNGRSMPGNEPDTTLYIGASGVKVVTGVDGRVITVVPKSWKP